MLCQNYRDTRNFVHFIWSKFSYLKRNPLPLGCLGHLRTDCTFWNPSLQIEKWETNLRNWDRQILLEIACVTRSWDPRSKISGSRISIETRGIVVPRRVERARGKVGALLIKGIHAQPTTLPSMVSPAWREKTTSTVDKQGTKWIPGIWIPVKLHDQIAYYCSPTWFSKSLLLL